MDKPILENSFCCNYPKCNDQTLLEGDAIRCYTCDSRITGLEGCMILNTSSVHVYNSASSSPFESCAVSRYEVFFFYLLTIIFF